jgi:hypothetical protein
MIDTIAVTDPRIPFLLVLFLLTPECIRGTVPVPPLPPLRSAIMRYNLFVGYRIEGATGTGVEPL